MRAAVVRARREPRAGAARTGAGVRACDLLREPELAIERVPDPTPAEGDVVIEVRAVGLCGSDASLVARDADGYSRFSGPAEDRVVLGHEFAGVVADRGRAAHLRVGELVIAEGMIGCGRCEACRTLRPNQCGALRMLGFALDGALARWVRVPARHVWSAESLAERVGDPVLAAELATLVEPLGCSYTGMFDSRGALRPGATVMVLGAGPVGLGAVLLARAGGAALVAATDRVAPRLALAREVGADVELSPDPEGLRDGAMQATRGRGFDLIVEAAGVEGPALAAAVELLAPGGEVLYLARAGRRVELPADAMVSAASCFRGSRGHVGGAFPALLRMLAAGRLPLAGRLLGRRVSLDSVAEELERIERGEASGKTIVHPSEGGRMLPTEAS